MTSKHSNRNMLLLSTIFLLMTCSTSKQQLNCNKGVSILTRSKLEQSSNSTTKYILEYKCLCPSDYSGHKCQFHKKLQCYLQSETELLPTITTQNYTTPLLLQLNYTLDCYVQNTPKQHIQLSTYLISANIFNNYNQLAQFSKQDVQVVWSNDLNIFDQSGNVKIPKDYPTSFDFNGVEITSPLTKQQQKAIMNGKNTKEAYQFHYDSYFLGFPLSNSTIHYKPKIILYLKSNIQLPTIFNPTIEENQYLSQINQTIQQNAKKVSDQLKNNNVVDQKSSKTFLDFMNSYISGRNFDRVDAPRLGKDVYPKIMVNLSVDVEKYTELEHIRIQISMQEKYNFDVFVQEISINSAKWRIPVDIEGIGKPILYKSFLKKTPKYVFALGGAIILLVIFVLAKAISSWRRKNTLNFRKLFESKLSNQKLVKETSSNHQQV